MRRALSSALPVCCIGLFLCVPVLRVHAGPRAAPLIEGFQSPPEAAQPRVWWHWMNGNISKDGIRSDLDWMHRVGIGGVNIIDASLMTPQVVKRPLIYMTPSWQDAFRYAVGLAHGYGFEVSIDSSPGWSETGGPWVRPSEAMKKLVWSATRLEGGKPFHGALPRPPDNTGPIQNAPIPVGPLDPHPASLSLEYYRDAIVLAYRMSVRPPRIEHAVTSEGAINPAQLSDGDLTDGFVLPPVKGGRQAWVQYDYGVPTLIQGITLAVSADGAAGAAAELQASDDGKSWRSAARIQAAQLPLHTVAFAPVKARYFRVTFTPAPSPIPPAIFTSWAAGAAVKSLLPLLQPAPAPLRYRVHELVLHAQATVNEAEAKADFAIAPDYYAIVTPQPAPGTAVSRSDVVVLTDHMRPDGTLDWTPPPGEWVVLRMGYSLLGTENHPAPPGDTGLEVDKLDRGDVQRYLQHYFGMYERAVGPDLFGRRGLDAFTVDSTEIGAQNWTEDMVADFRRLRGYDPVPWLPALTGVVIGSAQQTDKFLWDFRRTINELLARNHYGEIADMAHRYGLTNYAEALEDHRPSFGDDMEMRQYAAIPMGAMWAYGRRREPFPTYVADLRGAASVAHIYGRPLVGAESMDSAMQPWAYAPRELKPIIDVEFALGVNRVVVHSSVQQPIDRPPGLSLFIFGQFFNRLESWADYARPWVTYMARCSYLLQQGRYHADIAYFYGEEAPLTGLFGDKAIDVPRGYGFDFIDSDALLNQIEVKDGELATRSGMRYRVLYLGGSSRYMSLPVLKRLQMLVAQGAVLMGKRPVGSPSLADDPARFRAVADDLFGTSADHRYGKGRVIEEGSLAAGLRRIGLPPDFDYSRPEPDAELMALHRKLDHGDLYFVTNRLPRGEHVIATFRVAGMRPELWNAVTGSTASADYRLVDGRTEVPLDLAPYGSIFVVFRQTANSPAEAAPKPVTTVLTNLQGPWTIAFQSGRGAPRSITQDALESWSVNSDPGVRYFSGTATYTKDFTLPARGMMPGARIVLDLGDVSELAEVSLNDHSQGIAWTPPFVLDITRAVHPGRNRLEVKVTNLWVNRLIGDVQPDAKRKYTFTTIPTYEPNAPLRSSGLLGPVRIEQVVDGSASLR